MNKLQKKAWKDLIVCIYALIVGGIGFFYLILHCDGKSLPGRIIFLSVAIVIGIWVAVGQLVMKKKSMKSFFMNRELRTIYK